MNYFVIATDGQKYGPADINVLNQWIREGRLYPTTLLEPEGGGEAVAASAVPGLMFPTAQPTATMPTDPMQPGGGMPGEAAFGTPGAQQPYAAYPRGVAFGGELPDEVRRKFNWGAFLLTWIWGLNHKQYILLLGLVIGLIPVIGGFASLGFAIWAGINGNQWAWASGRFSTVKDMEDCQVIWVKWGVGMLILTLALVCAAVVLSVGMGLQAPRT